MTAQMEASTSSNGSLPTDIDNLLKLFNGPNSSEMYERHVSSIERLCRSNIGGFAIRDLPKIQQLLHLTLQLLRRGQSEFLQPALDLLKTLALPFVRRTSTDEFKMLNSITSMLTAVAAILEAPFTTQIKLAAIHTLQQFSTAQDSRPGALELAAMSSATACTELNSGSPVRQYHTNQSLIGRSGVIRSSVLSLAAALLSADAPLLLPLTQLLLSFSYLPDNATHLVGAGAFQCLPPLLSFDFRLPITAIAVELLWNIAEHAGPDATAALDALSLPSLRELLQPPAPPPPEPATAAVSEPVAAAERPASASSDAQHSAAPAEALTVDVSSSSAPPQESEAPGSPAFQLPAAPAADGLDGGFSSASGVLSPRGYGLDTEGYELGAEASQEQVGQPDGPTAGSRMDTVAEEQEEPEGLTPCDALAVGAATSSSGQDVAAATAISGEGDGGGSGGDGSSGGESLGTAALLAAALTALLQSALMNGHRLVDKELRNDVLVAATLLLRSSEFMSAASEVGFYDCIMAASTLPELLCDKLSPLVLPSFALTTEDPDLELRLLAWSAATTGAAVLPAVLQQAADSGLMRVLLTHACLEDTGNGAIGRTAGRAIGGTMSTARLASAGPEAVVARWAADQRSALRLAALGRLHVLAPLLVDQYAAEAGPQMLVQFVADACGLAHLAGQHLEAALRHLHHLAQQVFDMRDILVAHGAVPVLLSVVSDSHQQDGVRQFGWMLLATLCREQFEIRNRFRKAEGVQAVLQELRVLRDIDPSLPSPRSVALLDALWSAVVPDKKSSARFLVGGGADRLLDLLERGNRTIRPVLLGLLADMAENPKSHSFFLGWRSDINKQCIGRLLLSFWAEEDALRGMTLGGVLANPSRPLAGAGKRTAWLAPETVAYGNLTPERRGALQTVLEGVNGDALLIRLYALIKLLGFDSFTHLGAADQAALILIEKYIKFRQGEVWQQIKAEFEAEGMLPTETDSERLTSGIELSEHIAVVVREAQAVALGRKQAAQAAHEAKFYDGMRAQQRLEAEARHYVQDRSTMTMAELREAKTRKEAMLKASMRAFQETALSRAGAEEEEEVMRLEDLSRPGSAVAAATAAAAAPPAKPTSRPGSRPTSGPSSAAPAAPPRPASGASALLAAARASPTPPAAVGEASFEALGGGAGMRLSHSPTPPPFASVPVGGQDTVY